LATRGEVPIAWQTSRRTESPRVPLACVRGRVRVKDGEKVREAVLSADIRGKITAYKYVLSESLGRAAERSSFGNSLRSFATVVMLRVHCAQSFRPTCPVAHVYIRAPLLPEKETDNGQTDGRRRRKGRREGDDRVFGDRFVFRASAAGATPGVAGKHVGTTARQLDERFRRDNRGTKVEGLCSRYVPKEMENQS